ncbi:hypothetical protein C6P86_07610 [Burkholderia multivorans]|nr:hypothetical protein WM33_07425 [Burkholderia multivorans]KVZ75055.1 hypothetical protein WL23_25695 [Burkholderia multivorans]PRE70139.1 hypothetical protein C6P86_07610 [Burkholderia multivorans]PRE87973.1 hypothetical protein C6Q00_09715 [Burkholderia multivorans]PRG25473.1 hypothetical protein C6T57_07230 [Burkholderia multivorans]
MMHSIEMISMQSSYHFAVAMDDLTFRYSSPHRRPIPVGRLAAAGRPRLLQRMLSLQTRTRTLLI